MRTNRSKLEIVKEIYFSIQRGSNTPSQIRNDLHMQHGAVKEYLELIEFIQSLPKISIETLGRYSQIGIESALDQKSVRILNKKNTRSQVIPIDGDRLRADYKSDILDVWKWAGNPKKRDTMSRNLLKLKSFDEETIVKECELLFGGAGTVPEEILEKFRNSVAETISILEGWFSEH